MVIETRLSVYPNGHPVHFHRRPTGSSSPSLLSLFGSRKLYLKEFIVYIPEIICFFFFLPTPTALLINLFLSNSKPSLKGLGLSLIDYSPSVCVKRSTHSCTRQQCPSERAGCSDPVLKRKKAGYRATPSSIDLSCVIAIITHGSYHYLENLTALRESQRKRRKI